MDYYCIFIAGFSFGYALHFFSLWMYRRILVSKARDGGVEFINGKPYRIVPETEGEGE